MSLLNKASLIQIPSGYKDGTLYSAKPTNGDGDFTFSRGSNLAATRVNSEGLIEKGRENLALYSQEQTNGVYFRNNIDSVVAVSNPLTGENDAFKITSNTSDDPYFLQNITSVGNGVYTLSYWLWTDTGQSTEATMFFYNQAATEVNTKSITLTTTPTRYSFNVNFANTGSTMTVRLDFRQSGGSTQYIYTYGWQVERGLVATDYIPTTTTTAQAGILEDMPRLDYSGGASCPSLLLESQRTNSVLHSEFISTYFFYTNASASNNATTSPEGVVNAASIIPDGTSGIHQIASSNISASGSFTLSAFVKAGELNKIAIRESNATGAYASFDLSTGTKIEDNVSGDAFIEPFENDWYRIGVTYTYSGNIRLGINVLSNSYTTGNPSSGATYWSSNGTDKLYVYGLQCELGASYASSYIPSYGASVTRSADSCVKTGATALIGQTEGVAFCEVNMENKTLSSSWAFSINDGTTSNYIGLRRSGSSELFAHIIVSGTTTALIGTGITTGTHKIAIAYANNDIAVYVDGVSVGTDTSSGVPATSVIEVGDLVSNRYFDDSVKQFLLFKTRLTNDELASLTTI